MKPCMGRCSVSDIPPPLPGSLLVARMRAFGHTCELLSVTAQWLAGEQANTVAAHPATMESDRVGSVSKGCSLA